MLSPTRARAVAKARRELVATVLMTTPTVGVRYIGAIGFIDVELRRVDAMSDEVARLTADLDDFLDRNSL